MQGLDDRTRDLIQRRVLKRVKDIPSLPQFVVETLNKLEDPTSSAADVGNRLSKDEGLVVRVLRLANSAYYGLSRRITGVSEAIAFLGFKTVKSIVLAASVYKFMDNVLHRLLPRQRRAVEALAERSGDLALSCGKTSHRRP